MTKYLKILIFPVIALIGLLTFVGCSNSSDLTVTDFSTAKTTYSEGELIDFVLTVSNKKAYSITSVVINGTEYEATSVGLSTDSYEIEANITCTGTENFILTSVSYIKNGEELTLSTYKITTVSLLATSSADITIDNVSITNNTNGDTGLFYGGDELELDITVTKNKSAITLYRFNVLLTDTSGTTKTYSIGYIDNSSTSSGSTSTHSITFNLPTSISGDYTVSLSSINYTKGTTSLSNTDISFSTTLSVTYAPLVINDVYISNTEDLITDIDGNYVLDSSTKLTIVIDCDNDSEMGISAIYVNNTRYTVLSSEIRTYANGRTIITKTIQLSNTTNFPDTLSLDYIECSSDGSTTKVGAEISDTIYCYNKIITTESELKAIVSNNTISGRYFINNNINISDNSVFFSDKVVLDGEINLNGNTISANFSATNAMFKEIAEGATLKNGVISGNHYNSEVIAESNNGTISNVKLSGTIYATDTESTIPVLVDTNNGTISNIDFNIIMTGSQYASFSVLNENTESGIFKIVYINPQINELNNYFFFTLPLTNEGTVASVILGLNNWISSLSGSSSYVDYQNFVILNKDDNGEYTNIAVNISLRDTVDTLNKVIDGPSAFVIDFYKIWDITMDWKDTIIDAITEVITGEEITSYKYFGYEVMYSSDNTQFYSVVSLTDRSYYTARGFVFNSSSSSVTEDFWYYSSNGIYLNF